MDSGETEKTMSKTTLPLIPGGMSGTTVTLVVLKQSNTGIATVTVDGAVVDQLDTYSATRLFQQQKTYASAPGTHTISVAISGNKNAASGGPFIIFDALMVGFATPQSLVMLGQPGDSIVGTQPRLFTTGGATFSGSSAEGGTTVGINLTTSAGSFWSLVFAAPPGQLLAPGTYESAVRAPFRPAGVPGIEIAGEGRGCNTITGRFVSCSPSRTPLHFPRASIPAPPAGHAERDASRRAAGRGAPSWFSAAGRIGGRRIYPVGQRLPS